jgi:hypothetical protein
MPEGDLDIGGLGFGREGNRGDQPVSGFWDGLDDAGSLGVVIEGAAQLTDTSREDVITHEGVMPDSLQEAIFGEHLV